MGGHLLTRVAAVLGDRFERLLLLDPAIVSPELLDLIAAANGSCRRCGGAIAGSRRQEMVARLRGGRAASRAGMRAVPRRLLPLRLARVGRGRPARARLPPEVEGAVYAGQAGRDIYDRSARSRCAVHIVRARTHPQGHFLQDFSYSPTWSRLVNEFPNATETHLAEATHFFPMEDPALVAAQIAAWGDGRTPRLAG